MLEAIHTTSWDVLAPTDAEQLETIALMTRFSRFSENYFLRPLMGLYIFLRVYNNIQLGDFGAVSELYVNVLRKNEAGQAASNSGTIHNICMNLIFKSRVTRVYWMVSYQCSDSYRCQSDRPHWLINCRLGLLLLAWISFNLNRNK